LESSRETTWAGSERTVGLGSCIAGFMVFLLGGGYSPGILYEYQKKGLTEFAFRKCVILNKMFLAEQHRLTRKKALKKEKREQAPALQTQLSAGLTIARIRTKSRRILEIFR